MDNLYVALFRQMMIRNYVISSCRLTAQSDSAENVHGQLLSLFPVLKRIQNLILSPHGHFPIASIALHPKYKGLFA